MSSQNAEKIINWIKERFDIAKRLEQFPRLNSQACKAIGHICNLLFENSVGPKGTVIALHLDVTALEQDIFGGSIKGFFMIPVKQAFENLKTHQIEGKHLVEIVEEPSSPQIQIKLSSHLVKHAIQSIQIAMATKIVKIERKVLDAVKSKSLKDIPRGSGNEKVVLNDVQKEAIEFLLVGFRTILTSQMEVRIPRTGAVESASCIPGMAKYVGCGKTLSDYTVEFNMEQMITNFMHRDLKEYGKKEKKVYLEDALFVVGEMKVPKLNGPAYVRTGLETLAISQNALENASKLEE